MKKILFLMLAMVLCSTHDGFAQSRKERKATAKATTQSRGVKIEREECEELAMDITARNPRAAGNAISGNEAMATNLALLDARSNLAQVLEVMVNGYLQNMAAQYASTGGGENFSKSEMLQSAYFENILRNTRPIRKNTYMKEDGSYNVYVCVEMDPELNAVIYNKLRQDEILRIDESEENFKKKLDEQREQYLRMRANE